MCGRYTLTSPDDIAARFGLGALSETGEDIRPRFNISPSQSVPVIRNHEGETGLEMMRWGFQPHWMKGAGKRPPPINARSETLMERPMFKGAANKGTLPDPVRWLLRVESDRRPEGEAADAYPSQGQRVVAFAGPWTWGGDEIGPTCAIITCAPNELVESIHDCMPVILTEHGEHLWMDADAPTEKPLSVLAPYPSDLMEAFAVSTAVNAPKRDAPDLIEPA